MREIQVEGEEPPMNRLPASGFALALVVLLMAPAVAQSPKPPWETLKPGVQVLKLWEKIGPAQPQIAIFQVSNEAYKQFRKDPKSFVDIPLIFGEKVRPGAKLTELLSVPDGYSEGWVVTCFHRISMMRCASYPAKPPDPKEQYEK